MTPTETEFLEYALTHPEPDSYYYQLLTAVKLERVAPEVFDFLRPAHALKVRAKAGWIAAVSEARTRFGAQQANTAAFSLSGEEFFEAVGGK